jgi:2-succinyl-5-enolpyruvyl-6-hydroxy-3-cyclohexene-1-carboxylate synthase
MSPPTDTYLLLRAFVDELARCGLREACTSPGSRCAPLALSLAREPRLRCYSHIDERCAGFFALGLAKASGRPVAVTCTSGTAAAELLPAAIEAHEAGVPMLILTADRPPELRENGAGQTIDQIKLYGGAAKWFFEVGVQELSPREHEPSAGGERASDAPEPGGGEAAGRPGSHVEQRLRWMRTLACRAYWRSLEGRPGVVHLNFPLREPLVSDEGGPLPHDGTGRPDGIPYVRRPTARLYAPDAMAELSTLLAARTRGVVVAGRHERLASTTGAEGATPPRSVGQAAARFCAVSRWPLLADPLSGARRGEAAVAHYDALLRDHAFAAGMRPDVVIRVGALPTSKPLRRWLAGLRDVPQVLLDAEGDWQDPETMLCGSLAVEPARALAQLTDELRGVGGVGGARESAPGTGGLTDELRGVGGVGGARESTSGTGGLGATLAPADPDWLASWRSADERAAEAILGVLGAEGLSEPAVAAELGVLLPEGATLFVASSMPVRDIESFWPVRADPPGVLCNRGANGIDGTVSSAFGAAAEGRGPVVLLIGDVALAHDIGGLIAARRLELDLTIVLIDNGGGGIFDFLPLAGAPMARERAGSGSGARQAGADIARERAGGGEGAGHAGADAGEPAGGRDRSGARDAVDREDLYTRHIATPTGLDFALAAKLYGLEHEAVADVISFRAALERALTPRPRGSRIIEVRTDRARNVALHRRAWEAVAGVLDGVPELRSSTGR